MAVRGRHGRGQAGVAGQPSDGATRPPSYNTARGEQRREPASILVPEDFEVNEGDQAIPFTITNQFGCPTPARYIQVHMTNNPYVIAQLTANGPDYRGELHATPYNGTEPVDTLTDEAMRMLEPEFLAAELVSDSLCRMGDRTLCVTFGLHFIRRYIGLHRSFLTIPTPKPCTIRSQVLLVYDMILRLGYVRYDLPTRPCTISISEPPLLRYLGLGELRSLST